MLDFDGVIVDSARLKTAAYLSLFPSETESVRDKIRCYCEYHGGVPRSEKIRHIEEQILGRAIAKEHLEFLCATFAEKVLKQVLDAPWIAGAHDFLEAHYSDYLLFIVSWTPHDEMINICDRRGITHYFSAIGGSPIPKNQWINHFLMEHNLSPDEAVFVGDSITDFDAAIKAGIRFIGVGERNSGLLPVQSEIIDNLSELEDRLLSPTK